MSMLVFPPISNSEASSLSKQMAFEHFLQVVRVILHFWHPSSHSGTSAAHTTHFRFSDLS